MFIHIRKELTIKKWIALLLLVLCLIFIFANISSMYHISNISDGKDKISTLIPADDKYTVKQEFTAKKELIRSVNLMCNSEKYYETTGDLIVNLLDDTGKTVADGMVKTSNISNYTTIVVSFIADNKKINSTKYTDHQNITVPAKEGIQIKRGQRYTLLVTTSNVSKDDGLNICLSQAKDDSDTILYENDSKRPDLVLWGNIEYSSRATKALILFIALLLFTALFVIVPWAHVESGIKKDNTVTDYIPSKNQPSLQKWFLRALLILTPVICYWISYKIDNHTTSEVLEQVHTVYGVLNIVLLTMFVLVVYLITNRAKATIIISVALTYLFSIACYLLIQFRDIPLRATDFSDVGTAADVATNYVLSLDKSFLWITVVSICMIAAAVSLSGYKGLPLRSRLAVPLAVIVLFIGFSSFIHNTLARDTFFLTINHFAPTESYKLLGYPVGFYLSFRDLHVDKPEGYSANNVKALMNEYESDPAVEQVSVSEKSPNIIAIMNEAFSDLSVLGEIKTNKPYMPYFNSLSENAVRGTMYPSVYGGGTSNTEYEFLTGNSLAFIREKNAYTTLVNGEIPSLARTLKAQGYKGIEAFHPGRVDSYERNKVYPYMGFEKFISVEDLNNPEQLRHFVSDKGCYDSIIDEYKKHKKGSDKNSPFFLFNVTIQNHAGFNYSTGVVDAGIEIEDPALKMEQAEQYLNLIKKSDDALKYLLTYFETTKDPTVIVLFGDHQPRIEAEFYDEMTKRMDSKEAPLKKLRRKYQVPFVIWANYDIAEEKDLKISANMLSAYMLNKIGLQMTGYDKFLINLRKDIPVISGIAYMDNKGKDYKLDLEHIKDIPYGDEIKDYSYLEYYNIKEDSYLDNHFFTLDDSTQ